MVKNPKALRQFEAEQMKKKKISFKKAIEIFEALWRNARLLGSIKKRGKLEGIEKEIRIARLINGL